MVPNVFALQVWGGTGQVCDYNVWKDTWHCQHKSFLPATFFVFREHFPSITFEALKKGPNFGFLTLKYA